MAATRADDGGDQSRRATEFSDDALAVEDPLCDSAGVANHGFGQFHSSWVGEVTGDDGLVAEGREHAQDIVHVWQFAEQGGQMVGRDGADNVAEAAERALCSAVFAQCEAAVFMGDAIDRRFTQNSAAMGFDVMRGGFGKYGAEVDAR